MNYRRLKPTKTIHRNHLICSYLIRGKIDELSIFAFIVSDDISVTDRRNIGVRFSGGDWQTEHECKEQR